MVGIILWDKLPENVPFHWGPGGEVDGWASRGIAVFLTPAILLAVHILCVILTSLDPKNSGQDKNMMGLIYWISPSLSAITGGMVYAAAFGKVFSANGLMPLVTGILFIIIGNYLPKCRQNSTIGIKLKWTLESEENWNATHRAAGKIWVIGGLAVMATVLLPNGAIAVAMLTITSVIALSSVLYSYMYYRRHGCQR